MSRVTKTSKYSIHLIYKQRQWKGSDQQEKEVTRLMIRFPLLDTRQIKCTRFHYKVHYALASHDMAHVKRGLLIILMMGPHLMCLFPTTFSTDFRCFNCISHRTTSRMLAKLPKASPLLLQCSAKP